jgi:hypothetical protein
MIFKAEVKNQHDIKIKIVRSDRGDTTIVIPHTTIFLYLFVRFLYENCIVAQYSTPVNLNKMEWQKGIIAH